MQDVDLTEPGFMHLLCYTPEAAICEWDNVKFWNLKRLQQLREIKLDIIDPNEEEIVMALEPLFALSPKQPSNVSSQEEDDAPRITAFVNFLNITALAWGGSGGTTPTLATQLDEGWVYMSGSAAAPYDEDMDGVICNRERSQIVEVGIQGINVDERNKFLLVIELHALGENAMARLAVSRKILRTEQLRPGDNTISVLLDCPYDRAWVYLDIKHIKTPEGKASAFGFKSVTGYML